MTNSYKKEYPLAGFPGFGGGAGALYYKSASDKTYLEDVFSSNVWDGDATARKISNGVKLGNANAGNSVEFNGTTDYLLVASSEDFAFGTGDFTWEGWFYIQDDGAYLINFGSDVGQLQFYTWGGVTRRLKYYNSDAGSQEVTDTVLSLRQWYHIAAARSSNTTKVFIDGTEKLSFTDNKDFTAQPFWIGSNGAGTGSFFQGNISNVRIVKGTALYTSSFTPPTSALAATTNTKLLCCNGSGPFTATVTPNTITAGGNPLGESFGPYTADDGAGGMVWFKSRSDAYDHYLFNTVAGINSNLSSNTNAAQATTTSGDSNYNNMVTSFDNNGYSLGTSNVVNGSSTEYIGWTFGKKEGFFDIVTWTGTGSYRTLDHNLGCIPGFIMIKKTSGSESWICWHRAMGSGSNAHYLNLNSSAAMGTDGGGGSNPNASVNSVSSTQFTVGADNNGSGGTWVAYLFAGGESDAATARSVDFDGTDDTLTLDPSDDFHMTGDFTIEGWFNPDSWPTYAGFWGLGQYNDPGGIFFGVVASTGKLDMQKANNTGGGYSTPFSQDAPPLGQWTHVALVRSGSTITVYYNGTAKGSWTDSTDWGTSTNKWFNIASVRNGSGNNVDFFNGQVSNVRVVKGTAVYTSNFRVPTEPLTNITNTKLLCCNDSSTTGSTVTPGTITAVSSPTASTDSPFDDSEGFAFGDSDEGIIKCGSYVGNGSDSVDIDVHLGWEPTWLLVKQTTNSGSWQLVDSATHWPVSGDWETIRPNLNQAAYFATETGIKLTPTGFKIVKNWGNFNTDGDTHMFMAMRRPDGYVGKPADSGTSVFAMDVGDGSKVPSFISNFPVDFGFYRTPASSGSWYTGTRLLGTKYVKTDTNSQETTSTNFSWDYSDGWRTTGLDSSWQSWMWKRGQGMDVVNYEGNGVAGHEILHSLNQVPEMMWMKNRNQSSENWVVYHKDLNGGSNPAEYNLTLNGTDPETASSNRWNDTAPTSTLFTVGSHAIVNNNGDNIISMLFSSVTGISKCGSYTGTANSAQSISLGFQPRFLIIKNATGTANNWTTGWFTYDTTRGWSAPSTTHMFLNDAMANQTTNGDCAPTATGFDISAGSTNYINTNGETYIYYAHS